MSAILLVMFLLLRPSDTASARRRQASTLS
jgi:hypothetical protein